MCGIKSSRLTNLKSYQVPINDFMSVVFWKLDLLNDFQDSMCDKHLSLSKNKPPKSEILRNFPEGVADRTRMILMQVIKKNTKLF